MTHRDLDILIDCVENAQRTKKAAAEVIADLIVEGKMPTETQVRAYCIARMGVQSAMRDLENSMEIAATVAAEEA